MIRIAICDDNNVFLKILSKMVKDEFLKHIDDVNIENYVSGNLLLNHHVSKPFDVVFLDIDMPKIDGFTVAQALRDLNDSCYIIFVTAHSELVYDSFNFHPLNFITKSDLPLLKNRLHEVVEQIMVQIKQNKQIKISNTEFGQVSVYIKDILYIESNKHYVIYHLAGNKEPVQVRDNISELEKQMVPYDFFRVHRKYLINLRHVFNIDKHNDLVMFKQGFSLPMSRNYKAAADAKLTEFLRKS